MKYTTNLQLRKPDKEDFYNIEDFNFNADKLDEMADDKANKYEESEATISATGWTGTEAPYEYDLSIDATQYDVEVLLKNDATADLVKMVVKAQIAGNATDNKLRAWGTKPDSDIPVIIRKVAK